MTTNVPDRPQDPSDRSVLRASDADREAVVDQLRAAVADGRLDMEEFDERMGRAYAAKTFGELAPLTADLVGPPAPGEPSLTLHAVGSSVSRTGRWLVPRKIVIRGKAGSTRLDLTQARLTSPDVEIDVDASAGSVTIIVPSGTYVDTSRLRASFGSARVRTDTPDSHQRARLRLTIAGKCHMGSLTVRHPYLWEPWWSNLVARLRRLFQAR